MWVDGISASSICLIISKRFCIQNYWGAGCRIVGGGDIIEFRFRLIQSLICHKNVTTGSVRCIPSCHTLVGGVNTHMQAVWNSSASKFWGFCWSAISGQHMLMGPQDYGLVFMGEYLLLCYFLLGLGITSQRIMVPSLFFHKSYSSHLILPRISYTCLKPASNISFSSVNYLYLASFIVPFDRERNICS